MGISLSRLEDGLHKDSERRRDDKRRAALIKELDDLRRDVPSNYVRYRTFRERQGRRRDAVLRLIKLGLWKPSNKKGEIVTFEPSRRKAVNE